jgi:hypothetical protein
MWQLMRHGLSGSCCFFADSCLKRQRADVIVERHKSRRLRTPSRLANAPFFYSRGRATGCHKTRTKLGVGVAGLTLAKSMLSSSRVPLVDVAARMGFHTQQHLPKYFHRYTGMTPRAFRLAARSKLPASGRRTPGLQNPDKSSQE